MAVAGWLRQPIALPTKGDFGRQADRRRPGAACPSQGTERKIRPRPGKLYMASCPPACGRRCGMPHLANGAFRFRKLTRPINRRDENMLNHYEKDGAPLDALAPEDDWDLPQPPRQLPRREDLPPPPIKHEQSPASGEIARPVIENVPSRLPSQRGPDRCPAFMVRSALFRAGRIVLGVSHDGPVKGQGSYDLTLSGEQLYMRDKQVWQAAISIVKRAPRHDVPIRIELAAIATLMGSSDHCGGALRRIWQSVERLSRAAIQVKIGRAHV